jgi:hypothetical protein
VAFRKLDASREQSTAAPETSTKGNNVKRLLTTMMLIAIAIGLVQAEPRGDRRDNRNYIIRRQQAGLVQGPPTGRIIIGKRVIDIYRGPNGTKLLFEGDNLVGIKR